MNSDGIYGVYIYIYARLIIWALLDFRFHTTFGPQSDGQRFFYRG